jgi:protein-disulfide isomerase
VTYTNEGSFRYGVLYFVGTIAIVSIALNAFLILRGVKPDFWRTLRSGMLAPPKVRSGDHVRGPNDASITVIEYSDFECPFCKQLHYSLKRLVADSKIRWVYRNAPLTQLHPKAMEAAIAAECAGEQGMFWEYTDSLFDHQGQLSQEHTLDLLADDLGIQRERFNQCRQGEGKEIVSSQLKEAAQRDINATPTFYINRERIVGAIPDSELLARLKEARKSLAKEELR